MSEDARPAQAPTGEDAAARTAHRADVEPVDPQDQPAAGGADDGEPVMGEGEPDSY